MLAHCAVHSAQLRVTNPPLSSNNQALGDWSSGSIRRVYHGAVYSLFRKSERFPRLDIPCFAKLKEIFQPLHPLRYCTVLNY